MTIVHVRRLAAGALLALGVVFGVVFGGASAAVAGPAAPTGASIQDEWRPMSFHTSLDRCVERRIELEEQGRYSMWDSRCVQSTTNPNFYVLEVRGPRG